MILRVRSREGTTRVEVAESDSMHVVESKLREELKLDPVAPLNFSRQPGGKDPIDSNVTIAAARFRNGEMIHLNLEKRAPVDLPTPVVTEKEKLWDHDIDNVLDGEDGWIQRSRDKRMCLHTEKSKCVNCMPIAPWTMLNLDEYKEAGIKFLPFHAWLREREQGGKKLSGDRPLEDPYYTVKDCTKHPPWPQGICSECQPGSCMLERQPYRHVDMMEFEDPMVISNFMNYWRETGTQRCGYMYGRYEKDTSVPLGVKATVCAIYEPRQKSPLEPLDDAEMEEIDEVASLFGLERVGFIFTDLRTDRQGQLVKSRFAEKYLLTGHEMALMAKMQADHPNVTKKSKNNRFGSKFVTVLLSGTEEGSADIEAYQVSDQCASLVRDGIIFPGKASKKKMRARKTDEDQYIPDVSYRQKNEYNLDVIEKADPGLPTDFFLIQIRHGAPKESNPVFPVHEFPVYGRPTRSVTTNTLKEYLKRNPSNTGDNLKDWNLVLFLRRYLDAATMKDLASVITGAADGFGVIKRAVMAVNEVADNKVAPSPSKTPPAGPSKPGSSSSSKQVPGPAPKPQSAPAFEVNNELLQAIVSMGFAEQAAKEALFATNNSGIEAAVGFLSQS
eukprot:GFYU01000293.1.p1 GENE.GFYU01000293.1~~GFYU01000293.1.p1  ORF type:complete len:614 (-),score=197.83 GFYU01000293.1:291-2132(-)